MAEFYERGSKQLSYNFNYGQFSQTVFDKVRLLLDLRDFVEDARRNLASASMFYRACRV